MRKVAKRDALLKSGKLMLDYLDWNNKIAEHFFNPSKADTQVYLSVEKSLIEKIAGSNATFEDFTQKIKGGPPCPPWAVSSSQGKITKKAYKAFENWREKDLEYPPYIAYLALFVLSVNHGDSEDFSTMDYYGRLEDLVGQRISTQDFKQTVELWDDLGKWSIEDKKGMLGEFESDICGPHFYVGLPLSQVIFSKKDIKELHEIFFDEGWDSSLWPSEYQIQKLLNSKKEKFSSRIKNRINSGDDRFISIVTERVLKELEEYDNEESEHHYSEENSTRKGKLELCLEINNLSNKVVPSFRCIMQSGLPDDDFTLEGNGYKLNISSSWPKTSNKTMPKISNKTIIDDIDWKKSLSFESEHDKFRYVGGKYKIFTSAQNLGIEGWISGQRCDPSKRFYLAVHKSISSKIKTWGESSCNEFKFIAFDGMPSSWNLFEVKGIINDEKIREIIPSLAIEKSIRMRFSEGIRVSRGNRFFNFSLPKILITGQGGVECLYYYTTCKKHSAGKLLPDANDNKVFISPTMWTAASTSFLIKNQTLVIHMK